MKILETITNFFNKIAISIDNILDLPFFRFLKGFSGVISLILLVAVIALYIKTKYLPLKIRRIKWFLHGTKYEDKNFLNTWKEIIRILRDDKNNDLKEVLEKADKLANDVLSDLGFIGFNIEEKLSKVKPENLPHNSSQLLLASKSIKNISNKQEALKTLFIYELFLKDNGIL